MKTIILGDIHGKSIWKNIIKQNEDVERIIFIGDYFDSFDITTEKQINNFLDIVSFKENNKKEVVMLIGNHDHHYFKEVGFTGTSGYQHRSASIITQIIENNKHHLQIAFQFDQILCTHAGVCETFLQERFGETNINATIIVEKLNQLFEENPNAFEFNGWEPSGDNIGQTPIWIRPKSLMSDSIHLKKSIIQVVGHTSMKQIPTNASTNGRYYFIDTFDTSKQYLLVEDGLIQIMPQ